MNMLRGGIHPFHLKVVVVIDNERDARDAYEGAVLAFGERDGYCRELLDAIKIAFPADDQSDLLR